MNRCVLHQQSAVKSMLMLLAVTVISFFGVLFGGGDVGVLACLSYMQGDSTPYIDLVIDARILRVLLGIGAGSALAVSGCILQSVTKNPLADPGILGISTSASAAVVTVQLLIGHLPDMLMRFVAFAGSIIVCIIIVKLSAKSTGKHVDLLLFGVVITSLLSVYTQAVVLTHPAIFDSFRYWVIGSLSGATTSNVLITLTVTCIGVAIALALSKLLDALALGDEIAHSLGVSILWSKAALIVVAALLASCATAAIGPLAFLGLAIPHIVKKIMPVHHLWCLIANALLGAGVLVFADLIARTLMKPQEILVAILLSIIGAPLLFYVSRTC